MDTAKKRRGKENKAQITRANDETSEQKLTNKMLANSKKNLK